MPRRVVITGIGTASSLGISAGGGPGAGGAPGLWQGLCQGKTALGPARRLDSSGFANRLAGEVPEFAIKDYVPKHYRKATKVMARDIELAVAAAKLAVEDAGLVTRGTVEEGAAFTPTHPGERMGCHIGAGLIACDAEEMTAAMVTSRAGGGSDGASGAFSLKAWGETGMENLTPLWLLKYLPNMLACHVTIIHGAEGPSNTITCAEASGLLSIGESTRVILRNAADLCFSGGAESKVNVMGLLRLQLAGWVARSAEPEDGCKIVRPFEHSPGQEAGTVVGEGGGILVLEEFEKARARGANIYAEIVGFGGGHSRPWYPDAENDEGYRYAILNALDDAKVKPEQVSAIVPLGAGVPMLDRAELGALRAVFGDRLASIPLITMTPNVGLTIAGAGGLQAATAALSLKNQTLPARVHHGKPAGNLNIVASGPRSAKLDYVLACSGSLGAQNAAIVFKAVR